MHVAVRRAWLLFALALVSRSIAQVGALQDLATFPTSAVEITSGSQTHHFEVWVADTPERQAQGLMFVRDLPADRGMLFIHREPRIASMWMKNTYIELDMVFIGPNGRIVQIAERTTPHSLATIRTEVPVRAVLELRGGEAERRGFQPGDRVAWSAPET